MSWEFLKGAFILSLSILMVSGSLMLSTVALCYTWEFISDLLPIRKEE